MRTKTSALFIAAALALTACGCGSTTASGPDRAPTAAPKTVANPAGTNDLQPDARMGDAAGVLSVLSVEHQIDLATERDGVVLSVAKDEGSVVKAGDILGQLDDRAMQMELIKAKDDLRVAQNNVKFKEAELKAKEAAYKRQQQLRQYGLSSQADLESAEFQAKGAEYDLQGWEALVESGQAEVRRIEIEIDQTHLKAPFSGVVARRYIRQGETVAKGDKCFRVSQLSPLQVQFQVPESSPQHPQRGALVGLSLVGDPKRGLTARISKISPTIDPASDSYNVVAQLTGPGLSDLRPGMAVRVKWPAVASAPAKP